MKLKQLVKFPGVILNKQQRKTWLYLLVFLLCFLFAKGPCEVLAQGEPDDDERYLGSFDDESLYISPYKKKSTHSEAAEELATSKGIGTLPNVDRQSGTFEAKRERFKSGKSDQEDFESTDPPPPPTYPDAPVDEHILYLLAAGIGYRILLARKRHA